MIEEGLNKLKNREVLTALNIFKKLHKLNPDDGDILFFLGNIYYVRFTLLLIEGLRRAFEKPNFANMIFKNRFFAM